jgi:hypothetical protein
VRNNQHLSYFGTSVADRLPERLPRTRASVASECSSIYQQPELKVSPFGNTGHVAEPHRRPGRSAPINRWRSPPLPVPSKKNTAFVAFGTYLNVLLYIHPNYVQQWNLSIQRQMGANWRSLRRTWETRALTSGYRTSRQCTVPARQLILTSGASSIGSIPAAITAGLVSSIAVADGSGHSHYNGLMLASNHRSSPNFSGELHLVALYGLRRFLLGPLLVSIPKPPVVVRRSMETASSITACPICRT